MVRWLPTRGHPRPKRDTFLAVLSLARRAYDAEHWVPQGYLLRSVASGSGPQVTQYPTEIACFSLCILAPSVTPLGKALRLNPLAPPQARAGLGRDLRKADHFWPPSTIAFHSDSRIKRFRSAGDPTPRLPIQGSPDGASWNPTGPQFHAEDVTPSRGLAHHRRGDSPPLRG